MYRLYIIIGFYTVVHDNNIIKIKNLENSFLHTFIFIFNIIINQKRNNYKYWLCDFKIYKLMLYVIFFIFEGPLMLQIVTYRIDLALFIYRWRMSLDLDREIKIEWTDTSFELAHRPS